MKKLLSWSCVLVFLLSSFPAQAAPNGGYFYRTLSYFDGPRETSTRIFVELTHNEARINEFGGEKEAMVVDRKTVETLFNDFETLGLENYRDDSNAGKDADGSYLFALFDLDSGYRKYTIPAGDVAEGSKLAAWIERLTTFYELSMLKQGNPCPDC